MKTQYRCVQLKECNTEITYLLSYTKVTLVKKRKTLPVILVSIKLNKAESVDSIRFSSYIGVCWGNISTVSFRWSLFPLESYDSETVTVISLQPSSCVSALLFFLLLYQNLEEGYSLSESVNQTLPSPPPSLGNLSTLDITNDDDLPTDPSNSSDTQEESGCKQTLTMFPRFITYSFALTTNGNQSL